MTSAERARLFVTQKDSACSLHQQTTPNMNASQTLNRRQFLRTTGQAATTLVAASTVAPAVPADESAKTVGVGCIGLGTRGGDLINAVAAVPGVKVVAVSDVYGPYRQRGIERMVRWGAAHEEIV